MIKIHDPAELKNYTEDQIYRDPNSDDIYLRDGVQPVGTPLDVQKKLEQEENIKGRGLTNMEIGQMYPEYSSQYGQQGLSNLTGAYNQMQQAGANVQNMGNPATGMNILQEAIKTKNKVYDQPIGESQIFQKAGVGGIGALMQSLNTRGQEIKSDYVRFQNILNTTAGMMQDQISNTLNAYKIASNEYEQEMSRISQIDSDLRNHKQAIELMTKETEIKKELFDYENKYNEPSITNVGGYDISSYATDPNHEQAVKNIIDNIGRFNNIGEVDAYIKQITPDSPITGEMISKTSEKYNVPWEMLIAMMQQDSSLGTQGMGARNNNPGNIGQFDSLDSPVEGYGSWQEGVDAVGDWLNKHSTTEDTTIDEEELTKDEIEFQKRLDEQRELLAQRKTTWAKAWDTIKGLYPDIDDETLDQLLNKDKYFTQDENSLMDI